VRVRFAPSPTGPLHIGSARTALFNYIYARQNKGVFILRFEDTDISRNQKVFEENILAGLKWLGLNADETYYQSKRPEIYKTYLQKLVDKNLTYEHDGGIYFRLPTESRKIIVDDFIRGKIEFASEDFDDLVLFKKDGTPTFHFANVVDDIEMNITHVIRGEDHLSNTPRQILLYEAFSAKLPKFAHLPLILNPDRTKMSKRAGDVDLDEYVRAGYLPEAIINFLAQLGWADKAGKEFFTLAELLQTFELERVQKGGAVFDVRRLNYLNHHYLMGKSLGEYTKLVEPYLGVIPSLSRHSREGGNPDNKNQNLLRSALKLVQDRAQILSEIPGLIDFFFALPDYQKDLLVFKKSSPEQTAKGLNTALKVLETMGEQDWKQSKLQQILDEATAAEELQPGDLFWPVRVALSGRDASPSPVELLEALGKQESVARIRIAINKMG